MNVSQTGGGCLFVGAWRGWEGKTDDLTRFTALTSSRIEVVIGPPRPMPALVPTGVGAAPPRATMAYL
jgi:hypothetical protein